MRDPLSFAAFYAGSARKATSLRETGPVSGMVKARISRGRQALALYLSEDSAGEVRTHVG
jgi:hypothetical protein